MLLAYCMKIQNHNKIKRNCSQSSRHLPGGGEWPSSILRFSSRLQMLQPCMICFVWTNQLLQWLAYQHHWSLVVPLDLFRFMKPPMGKARHSPCFCIQCSYQFLQHEPGHRFHYLGCQKLPVSRLLWGHHHEPKPCLLSG